MNLADLRYPLFPARTPSHPEETHFALWTAVLCLRPFLDLCAPGSKQLGSNTFFWGIERAQPRILTAKFHGYRGKSQEALHDHIPENT